MLLPKIIVNRVKLQLDRARLDGKPDDSGFYRPFRRFPAAIPAADQARLSAAGLERVRATVIPAFASAARFHREGLPAVCYDQVGWWQNEQRPGRLRSYHRRGVHHDRPHAAAESTRSG